MKGFIDINNKRSERSGVLLFLLGLFIFYSISVMAQEELVNHMGKLIRGQESILEELKGGEQAQAAFSQQKERIKTFICPKDAKEFQLVVRYSDTELEDGAMPIFCPYDGFQFYPSRFTMKPDRTLGQQVDLKELGEWYWIRSPMDGKKFRARINMEELLSGNAIFTSPFDGTQFHFTPQVIQYGNEEGMKPGMETVVSPATGRKFRALIDNTNPRLTDPYTGAQMLADRYLTGSTSDRGEQNEVLLPSNKVSRIESLFMPLATYSIAETLEQFGYALFPSEEDVARWKRDAMDGQSSPKNDLLQNAPSGMGNVLSGLGGLSQSQTKQGFFMSSSISPYADQMASSVVLINRDYILGPGDVLNLYIWGNIQQSLPLTIDQEGKIFLPQIGPLLLSGLTFSQAEEIIKQKLAEKFTNFQMSMSMGRLRKIPVFVFGEVKIPGSHYVSSQVTLMQTLFIAGGPTKMGSLRKIKLIRHGEENRLIDLYKIFINGEKESDLQIRDNDVLLIPPIGDVVAIRGSVKRPAIYELPEDTSVALGELIQMAGGLDVKGYAHRLQIERVAEHARIVIKDFEFTNWDQLESEAKMIKIQGGDQISIFSVASIKYNYISIEGNVLYPGNYEWKEGMTVKVLLEKAGGFRTGTYLERADIIHPTKNGIEEIPIDLEKLLQGDVSQDMPLKQWDRIKIYDLESVRPSGFIEITGTVRKPGIYPYSVGMKISDLLFKAGGLEPQSDLENAELVRINRGKGAELINVNLRETLEDKTTSSNCLLQEGDQLFVRTIPDFWQQIKVNIGGEVSYPGEYVIQKGEHLSSLIERAGGFTEHAYPEGAILRRNSIREMQKELFQRFIQREQQTLLQEQSSLSFGFSDTQSQARDKLKNFQDKLARNADQENLFSGRLIVHLKPYERFKGSQDDVVLQNGDFLLIPPVPSYVLVVNNLQQAIAVTYEEGRGVEYYVKKAGGLHRYDNEQEIFVITAAGDLKSQFVKSMPIYQGDMIIIPQKIQYRTATGLIIKDTVSTLYQIGLGAIAVSSIK